MKLKCEILTLNILIKQYVEYEAKNNNNLDKNIIYACDYKPGLEQAQSKVKEEMVRWYYGNERPGYSDLTYEFNWLEWLNLHNNTKNFIKEAFEQVRQGDSKAKSHDYNTAVRCSVM